MFSLISSGLSSIKNYSLLETIRHNVQFPKCAKIAAVALAIFGALSALYLILRRQRYSARTMNSTRADIQTKISSPQPNRSSLPPPSPPSQPLSPSVPSPALNKKEEDVKQNGDNQESKELDLKKGDSSENSPQLKKIKTFPAPQRSTLGLESDKQLSPQKTPSQQNKSFIARDDAISHLKKMSFEDNESPFLGISSEDPPPSPDMLISSDQSSKDKPLSSHIQPAIPLPKSNLPAPSLPHDLLPSTQTKEAKNSGASLTKDLAEKPLSAPPRTLLLKTDQLSLESAQSDPSPFLQVDRIFQQVEENIFCHPSFSAQRAFAELEQSVQTQVRTLLNELVENFEKRYPPTKKIGYGDLVPPYFANVANSQQKESDIKYLSLVGIRNMLKYGPSIIDDFRKTHFLGGEHNYEEGKGLKAFKTYTGTVVDLDTELEKPTSLASIDPVNDQEAIKKAKELIINFGKVCGLKGSSHRELTAEEVARQLPKRNLHLPDGVNQHIHVSCTNLDRSLYGIWKRLPPGQSKYLYYVNVPMHHIVLMATLRLPYLIAEVAYLAKKHNGGTLPQDFLDNFFDKGLSTMCFNQKLRVFMEFYEIYKKKYTTESPAEIAKRKIIQGEFGPLRHKEPEQVLKEAYNRQMLINLFDQLVDQGVLTLTKKGSSMETWIKENINNFGNALLDKGLWESVLYQSDKEQEYLLLNGDALKFFMSDYFDYL
jgi:hypothetical protein